jgi:hypothetical protein
LDALNALASRLALWNAEIQRLVGCRAGDRRGCLRSRRAGGDRADAEHVRRARGPGLPLELHALAAGADSILHDVHISVIAERDNGSKLREFLVVCHSD